MDVNRDLGGAAAVMNSLMNGGGRTPYNGALSAFGALGDIAAAARFDF